jgi:chromosome segregation ATPase
MTKDQLKLIALKQRIGEITSQYEDQIADMRASFTQQMEAMSDALKDSDKTIENLQNQLRKSSETLQEDDPDDQQPTH